MQGQCGSEVVKLDNVCTLHLNYLNDWGCETAVIEPCNGTMPLTASPASQRRCHDDCLSTCPAAGLGCEFMWLFIGVL